MKWLSLFSTSIPSPSLTLSPFFLSCTWSIHLLPALLLLSFFLSYSFQLSSSTSLTSWSSSFPSTAFVQQCSATSRVSIYWYFCWVWQSDDDDDDDDDDNLMMRRAALVQQCSATSRAAKRSLANHPSFIFRHFHLSQFCHNFHICHVMCTFICTLYSDKTRQLKYELPSPIL